MTADPARLAQAIAASLQPRSAFDATGTLAAALRALGIDARTAGGPLPESVDLVVCLGAPGKAAAEALPGAGAVLFSGEPLEGELAWFAAQGFAPDLEYDAATIAPGAVLLRRGPAPAPAVLALVAQLARERRLTLSLAHVQRRLSAEAAEIRQIVEEGPAPALLPRVERLERSLAELRADQQALAGRIEGLVESRTWRALNAAAAWLLRAQAAFRRRP